MTMQSFVTLYLRIREIINDCGPHGKKYHDLCKELSLTVPIQKYIARKLFLDHYKFKIGEKHVEEGSFQRDIPLEMMVFTPLQASQIYYFQSYDEIAYDQEIYHILGYLGRARADGLTLSELQKIHGKKFNINVIDKLIGYDIVIKQTIMPKFGKSSKRTSTVCNIIHLKKYAQEFDPDSFGLKVAPLEIVQYEIILLLSRLLESAETDFLTASEIRKLFNIGKKAMQNFRGNIVALEKQKDHLPIRFECKTTPGSYRKVWCLVRNPVRFNCYPVFSRIRNIPYHEQLHLYIHQRGSITNNDIKRLTSVPRKKSFRTGQDLIYTFGFPTVKEQEYKTYQYRILPKSTQRPVVKNLNNLEIIDSENNFMESNENDLQESSRLASSFQKEVQTEVKTFQPYVRNKKRKIESPTNSASSSDESNHAGKKKSNPPVAEKLKEDKKVLKETLGKSTERDSMILELIQKSTYGVCSLLEIGQSLRDFCRERNLPLIDKKTIVRARDRLISNGEINSITVPLDAEKSKNFNNMKESEFLYIPSTEGTSLEERLNNYIQEYRFWRFGYKRKIDSKAEPEAESEIKIDPPVPAPINDSQQDVDETVDQPPEIPKLKRRRRSKIKKEDPVSTPQVIQADLPTEVITNEKNRYTLPIDLSNRFDFSTIVEEIVVANDTKHKEEEEQVPDPPLQVDDDHHLVVEERGVEKRDKTKNDIWGITEDIELLFLFLINFFVRKARQGMPDYMKPSVRAKKVQNLKSMYALYPWDSCFDIDWKIFGVSFLTYYHVRNATTKTNSHTLASCRRRINRLLKGISNFHHLISYLLQLILLSKDNRVSSENIHLLNYILHLSGKNQGEMRINQCVLTILLKFYGSGVVRPTEVLQVLPQELDNDYLRLVMKELFLHGFLKTAVLPQTQEAINNTEATFRFTKNYQKSITEKMLGLFYYLIIFDQNYKFGVENYQEEELDSILDRFSIFMFEDERSFSFHLFTFELISNCHRRMNQLLEQQHFSENNITSIISIHEKDSIHTYPLCHINQYNSGGGSLINYELATERREANEFADKIEDSKENEGEKGSELIQETDVKLIFSCAEHQHFYFKFQGKLHNSLLLSSVMESMKSSSHFNLLPWIDNEGGLNLKIFNVFACQVISYLSECPGASLQSIHSILIILPFEHVEILVQVLQTLEIVKRCVPTHVSYLSDPFESLDFWDDSFGSKEQSEEHCGYQVCVV